ncbi:MAG: hypothetical protein IJ157_08260 [Clostridia bacterium]|nr:hypothetical protein [Clostridia bacterium]
MMGFSWIIPALAGALMGAMLVFPRQAAAAALQALGDFSISVLPGLLPFSACALLITAGRTLPLSLLTVLALPGGSPTGARLFRDAGLPPSAARKIAARTGNMSPMFFLYTLSAWLGDPRKGRLLLASHLGAAMLAGCFFRGGHRDKIKLPSLTVPDALTQSAQAMLGAAACASLGAVGARMLGCALPGLPPGMLASLQSLLEITSGMKALTALSAPLPLLAGFTGFTGLSILLQNAAFWQKSGLSLPALMKIALLRAMLAFLLCTALEHLAML